LFGTAGTDPTLVREPPGLDAVAAGAAAKKTDPSVLSTASNIVVRRAAELTRRCGIANPRLLQTA
jgi:hypothetical protein